MKVEENGMNISDWPHSQEHVFKRFLPHIHSTK